jgi:hemerythrin superfamily protein
MTSIAHQDTAALGGPLSILTRQKRDHRHLDHLLRGLEGSRPGPREDAVLARIARLVFPHAFAEESVLWPEVRRVLPGGEELTLRVEQEHQEVNELWTHLERMSPADASRTETLARLVAVLRQDVRDEEDELLPRLQEVLDRRRLQLLGVAWEVVRRTAPTRPHPVVSRRPPGNVLAALPLTALDRGRDLLDAVARTSPRLDAPASLASDRLRAVADRTERARWLRRGEDPSTGRGPDA